MKPSSPSPLLFPQSDSVGGVACLDYRVSIVVSNSNRSSACMSNHSQKHAQTQLTILNRGHGAAKLATQEHTVEDFFLHLLYAKGGACAVDDNQKDASKC